MHLVSKFASSNRRRPSAACISVFVRLTADQLADSIWIGGFAFVDEYS
jgi:hypothetical protein